MQRQQRAHGGVGLGLLDGPRLRQEATRLMEIIGVPGTLGCEATELADGCQSMAWPGRAL